jgi:hypothetical protein
VDVITVVLWKWGKKFTVGHVRKMQSMLSRHLHQPHQIVCITDRPEEMPKGITPARMPPVLPWDYKGLRRMWLYSAEAGRLGSRLLQLDLDVVLTDSIDPIVNRSEDFVIWKSDSNWKDGWAYNATVMLITPGAKEDVWQRYMADPRGVLKAADRDGWGGQVNSDQALACYLMKDQQVAVWTQDDGIYAYRVFAGKHGDRGQVLPAGARIVSFHGPRDPSQADLQVKSPWILEHWR